MDTKSPVRRLLGDAKARLTFHGSSDYWDRRYASGGTSGPGSYGEVAEYKARFLNDLVRDRQVGSVIEFGCGDGNQLSLADYPQYVGLDVSKTAIEMCSRRFVADPTKSFALYDPAHFQNRGGISADLSLSLDVIYHLVEDRLYEAHMLHVFAAARRLVAIFADNVEDRTAAHVRRREFTRWVDLNQPEWQLVAHEPNPIAGPDSTAEFFVYERHQAIPATA